MSVDLAVLGAGPAGLTAAWRAARRGMRVTVLERAAAVGGMAASFDVDGVRVDHGSHRLHPSTDPRILADLHDLLGDDLQLRQRNGRLRVRDRWVGFPLRPAELAQSLPKGMIAKVAGESLTSPLRRSTPSSYADALRGSLGRTLYETLYAPYAVKLWGLPGEEIDVEQARRRVTADTPVKIAARIIRARRGSGQGRVFYYPKHGFGQISTTLADAAVSAGADIRCGANVTEVDAGTDGVELRTADGDSLVANQVFSTVPLPVLARVTQPGPAPEVLDAAGQLDFRAMLLVYVTHDGPRPWTEHDAHYLPGPETPVTRISEPANYRDSSDDPVDRTVLCAEIPCDRQDALWAASDADLGELVAEAAQRTGLPPIQIAGVQVRRLPRVYPVYRIGYRRHLDGIDAWADSVPRVTTFGRLGLFAHDNTHHAMIMAYDAVEALSGEDFDAGQWAAARARFSTHVVED